MDKALWEQLQPLIDEALSLSDDARGPWLSRVRAEAPTIAGELERLFAHSTLDRRGFLETPVHGSALIYEFLDRESTSLQRTRLGSAVSEQYTLGDMLGRGGMATVYRARDLRHRRDVAIKVIRPDAATALGAERFLEEIRLTANLTHPHILPLLDSGAAAGVLYFVMPFVDGESLRVKLRREGALPIEDATRILRAVAEALAHAHGRGLVHRDIKPDNVLLAGREAWVADFGIAKAMTGTPTVAHPATSVGMAIGSPGYMAPEQIEAAGDVDHRADLYSWGAMAWEMLAGRPLFVGGSMQHLFTQHLTAAPEHIAAVRPDVPPPLADAVMRCLAKTPQDRFASAEDMLAQFDAVTTSEHRPQLRDNRRRWWLAGSGVVAAATLAGVWALRDRSEPWGALRTLSVPADIGSTALSPAGTTVAFTRSAAPGIWLRHIDSTADRQVSRERTAQIGFVDDSTLLAMTVQRGAVFPSKLIDTRSGLARAIPFQIDSTGTWSWTDPGFITHFTVTPDRRSLITARMTPGGMRDTATLALDVGEQPRFVTGTAAVPGYLVGTMLADSSLRLSRIGAGRTRQLAGAVPADDSLRHRFSIRARLTLDGRYADMWLARDTVARFDLEHPDRGYSLILHPVPAPFGGRARTGDALVYANDRTSELWRIPVPGDPTRQARMVDRTRGDVREGVLSPDERVIARVTHPRGPATALFVQSVDGGAVRWLLRSPGNLTGVRWSPDGSRIAVREVVRGSLPRWAIVDPRDGSVMRLGPIRSTWLPSATPSSYPAVWSRDGLALYATSLDTLAPEIRRFALNAGDTGVVVYRGTRIPSLLDGLALHPDGTSLAVGGDELLVVPLNGGPARTVVPLDTTTYRIPFLYQQNGTIAFAVLDEGVRRGGALTGLLELFTVSDRGGPSRAVGSFPTPCNFHVGLLRGDSVATCFATRQVPEHSIIHAGRH